VHVKLLFIQKHQHQASPNKEKKRSTNGIYR